MSTEMPVDVSGRPLRLREVDLDRFFRPDTLAVLGASDTEGRPNTAIHRRLVSWAARVGATVYPVNPNRDTVDGARCYASVADLPTAVDVAVVLTGDPMPSLEALAANGTRFAVVFAAGFAESGEAGRTAQRQLTDLLDGSSLRLLGPNTNLNAFETFRDDLTGPAIALISQSGHQGRPIFQAQENGVRLSHWAPTGNEADLEFADFLRYFVEQKETGAVAAYIEGFADGRTVQLACDAAARRGVPVVMVKVGRNEAGRSMASSHTGKLTGTDAVTSAVLRQFGVTRVDGLDELADTAQLLARARPPRGNGVCVYAISGGTGAHMADMCAEGGLHLPALSEATQKQLHEWIPGYLRVSNPVDNGGHPVGDWRGRRILDTLLADPDVDVIVCPITGAFPPMSDTLAADLVAAAETTDKLICVVWGSPVGTEPAYRDVLLSSDRLAVFRTFGNCVRALRAWFDHAEFRTRYRSPFADVPTTPSAAAARARGLLAEGGALSEHRAKELLACYGIASPSERLVTSPEAAAHAADEIGYPVVLKACGPGLTHKSELGLVRTGLWGAGEVADVCADLLERAAAASPDLPVEGVLVCETVTDGVEAVVGLADDEVFGPTVMVGAGGVLVELLGDVAFRVPPFDLAEAHRMVDELRLRPLLDGVRGRAPVDVDALCEAAVALGRMALELGDIVTELDVNPLVVRTQGVVALDALAVSSSDPG